MKELQSLALDVKVLDENDEEVELKESIDYGETNINAIINNDRNFNSKKMPMILKKLVIQHRNSLTKNFRQLAHQKMFLVTTTSSRREI